MTLTQLRYIVSIVDAGLNITAAAERVHATQPTISKQLKLLEDELGFALFARRGKSLSKVTPAGARVIDSARDVVEQANSIRSLAENLRGENHGELNLVTTHTQARFVLPRLVSEFSNRYPDVTVHLQPQSDASIVDQFAGGSADLALISTSDSVPPGGGVAIPVYRWSRVLALPLEHPLGRLRRPLQLADLIDVPLVSYDSSVRPESSLQKAFGGVGSKPDLVCTSGDADVIKAYAKAGLGVGIVAQMAVRNEDRRDLIILDGSDVLPECTTWLVLRRDRVLRGFVLEFLRRLLPHVSLRDVERTLAGEAPSRAWPKPPHWNAWPVVGVPAGTC